MMVVVPIGEGLEALHYGMRKDCSGFPDVTVAVPMEMSDEHILNTSRPISGDQLKIARNSSP